MTQRGSGRVPEAVAPGAVPHGAADAEPWTELRSLPFGATRDDPDPWAWVDVEPEPLPARDLGSAHVTAVLVCLDAERWLPATLDGLAALEHRPQRLVAVDNGSTDGTAELLREAREQGLLDAVHSGPGGSRSSGQGSGAEAPAGQTSGDQTPSEHGRGGRAPRGRGRGPAGFGAAVEAGLAAEVRAGLDEEAADAGSRWLWLLHDDAVPEPDALRRLLDHVLAPPFAGGPPVDVTGPKLLLPQREAAGVRLAEVGVTISGTGRRELLLDPGEVDQGQRDQPQPRLAVSTCGMLLRREVWDDLGGLDPVLPVFRDGVELGWRAHLRGYRVVTTPAARMTHLQVGRAGLRRRGVAGRHPARLDRRLGLLVVAGHAPMRLLPLVWLRLAWSCLLHAVGFLFGKVPARSVDELAALAGFALHPGRLAALRRRVRRTVAVPGAQQVVRSLRPPWWSGLRLAGEGLTGLVSERYRSVAGEGDGSSLDELTGDDFAVVAEERPRYFWLNPVVLALAATTVGALVAARGLFGSGSLAGPALLPAPDRVGTLWASVWDGIAGAPDQSSPPWLALTAVGSTLLAGRPEWLVTLLLCGMVPLALLTAYPVARRALADRRLRQWVALSYALLPVLLGAGHQGRLSLAVLAVLLPLLVTAVRALVLRRVRTPEAWRGAWGSGALLAVLAAFEPQLLLLAVPLALLGVLVLRRAPRKVGRVLLALALPVALLLPWAPSLILAPGRLLVGPDAALLGAPTAPRVWALLLGRDAGVGLPSVLLSQVVLGVVWLVALGGLLRRPTGRLVQAGWVTALLAFALAIGLSRLVVAVPPLDTQVRPAVTPLLLVGFAALLLAGAAGVDGLSRDIASRSFSWLQPVAVLAGLVVGAITLTAAGWWVWTGSAGPLTRGPATSLPPYLANAMLADTRSRVLAVDLTEPAVRYAVLADRGLRLGDADRGGAFGGSTGAAEQSRDLVVRLVAGTADADLVPQLGALGIGYVVVRGADDEVRARIGNTPGLGAASGDADSVVWELEPPVSRVVLLADGGREPLGPAPVEVEPGSAGRTLLIGEPADARWVATLDGVPLTPAGSGWQQAWTLPASGGRLVWSLTTTTHWFLPAQGLLLLVALVLAAPAVRRPELRDPARAARRTARLAPAEPAGRTGR